jgi:catechol 2,3-dioxygenase-like lactoylglutathione lyase family enzyme
MLGSKRLIAFIPTVKPAEAKAFYQDVLGLRFIREDQVAVVFDANGTMLRITIVPEFTPYPFTVAGWSVLNIEEIVTALAEKGIAFERYSFMEQDSLGIWTSSAGTKVAWFKDPDGNLLSVSQHM